MDILIKCECGNKVDLSVYKGKMMIICDNLEHRNFRLDSDGKEKGGMTELRLCCVKCRNWITLGSD